MTIKLNHLLILSSLIIVPSLSACATAGAGHTPIIDAPKDDRYYSDLGQCRALAEQRKLVNGDTQQAAAIGAAAGAAIRAIGPKDSFEEILGGAAIGGVLGGGAGVFSAQSEQKHILLSCMAGRGYRVLG